MRWIREGIKRNAASHEGTEWLHVKILEAKVKAANDPHILVSKSISGADYAHLKRQGEKAAEFDGHPLTVEDLDKALKYQLQERVGFVKPPDKVVAALMVEHAQTSAILRSVHSAFRILELSEKYGYPALKIKSMKLEFQRLLNFWSVIHSIGGVFIVIGSLFICYKRGWLILSQPRISVKA